MQSSVSLRIPFFYQPIVRQRPSMRDPRLISGAQVCVPSSVTFNGAESFITRAKPDPSQDFQRDSLNISYILRFYIL